jgi:hypothetical protein
LDLKLTMIPLDNNVVMVSKSITEFVFVLLDTSPSSLQCWFESLTQLQVKTTSLSKRSFSLTQHVLFCLKMKPAFESCQWSPSSYNAQTTCAMVVMEKKKDNGKHILTWLDFYWGKYSKCYATIAFGIWQAHWEIVLSWV